MKRDRKDYWRERSRQRRKSAAYRKQNAARVRAWYRIHGKSPAQLKRKAQQMRESIARHPDRACARRKIRHEIEMGRIVRLPCEVCGEVKTHAHHDNYSQPLNVRWLCRKHHDEHHAKATSATPQG